MDQMLYVREWGKVEDRMINNFITATSFNEVNATYVIKSVAYGLGYSKVMPNYQPTTTVPQPTTLKQSNNDTVIWNGIALDKTWPQFNRMSNASQLKYKEAAEGYLESIIEYKTNFEKELGAKVNAFIEFNQYANITVNFEIDGKIHTPYDFALTFYVLFYDIKGRIMTKEETLVGEKRSSFETAHVRFLSSQFQTVSNVKRIVIYWEP